MIDPRDVRAGNWVLKITGTDNNAQSFYEYQAIALDEHFFKIAKDCLPILLTPVVLGNCGFRHEFGDWFMNMSTDEPDSHVLLLRYKHKEGKWYFKNADLPVQPVYLHQLQNLYYALTNQELSINLGFFENLDIVAPIDFLVKLPAMHVPNRELL